ncbi:MAG: hypothetical protein M0R50_11155 [Candidatus Cloacimonetes bacterium]|jgi:hypothetical protein|nr:hypothetical protein [Candidatus Cloacimonadota bacterium]
MTGVILGSGVVGLLAKEILGDQWLVIPFSRSRFYSFRPALADNFIIRDDRIDDLISHFGGKISFIYKTSYSLGGNLLQSDDFIINAWLNRVFGLDVPPQAAPCIKSRGNYFIYDIKVNQLYHILQQKYSQYLIDNSKKTITEIGDHYLIWGGQRIDFDHMISTIQLSRLFELTKIPHNDLPAAQVWYYHVETSNLNFEGANQTLVIDDTIDFFKVSNIAENRYLFYFSRDIPIPGPYFMQFMQQFDLIDGTTIAGAIPKGAKPDLSAFNKLGIECIGAAAEHDYFMDLGSCLVKLLRQKTALTT